MKILPEKQVEIDVLAECQNLNIDVDVIDSKATFSVAKCRYSKSKTATEGMPDLIGNDQNGIAVFIELKARGKLSTLRPKQRLFLERKIRMGCFAVVLDNANSLTDYYLSFLKLKAEERTNFLFSLLP